MRVYSYPLTGIFSRRHISARQTCSRIPSMAWTSIALHGISSILFSCPFKMLMQKPFVAVSASWAIHFISHLTIGNDGRELQPLRGVRQSIIWPNFCRKLHENERIWTSEPPSPRYCQIDKQIVFKDIHLHFYFFASKSLLAFMGSYA